MRSSDVIKAQLFLTSWREAKALGLESSLAGETIAWALANRVRRNMGTWAAILNSVAKYRTNDVVPTDEFPNLWDAHVVRLMQNIDGIYDNIGNDLANGGMFYCRTDLPTVDWFKNEVVKHFKRSSSMNSLVCWGEQQLSNASNF